MNRVLAFEMSMKIMEKKKKKKIFSRIEHDISSHDVLNASIVRLKNHVDVVHLHLLHE